VLPISESAVLVTGGASGLGRATAELLARRGAEVTISDLESSAGVDTAARIGARFVPADVRDPDAVQRAVQTAASDRPLRFLVHCAGRGGPLRLVDRDGQPGSLETFQAVIDTNLVGTFNVLRLAAAQMATNDPVEGERGACVLTASVAAYEGQIGQVPYASSKGGVVGMTIVAARDLARRLVRVVTIAPGTFDTPLLGGRPQEVLDSLAAAVPHPSRLGKPSEYAALAVHVLENPMINGETIRLDGALRMPPR
jgi:NAD(P)-dependent dehydrogenase (short-subunit alcohol dehydrogenase family)